MNPRNDQAALDLQHCRNHPERHVSKEGQDDRLCQPCVEDAWNAGARMADDGPRSHYQWRNSEGNVEEWKE